jgi:hypothetical protein
MTGKKGMGNWLEKTPTICPTEFETKVRERERREM